MQSLLQAASVVEISQEIREVVEQYAGLAAQELFEQRFPVSNLVKWHDVKALLDQYQFQDSDEVWNTSEDVLSYLDDASDQEKDFIIGAVQAMLDDLYKVHGPEIAVENIDKVLKMLDLVKPLPMVVAQLKLDEIQKKADEVLLSSDDSEEKENALLGKLFFGLSLTDQDKLNIIEVVKQDALKQSFNAFKIWVDTLESSISIDRKLHLAADPLRSYDANYASWVFSLPHENKVNIINNMIWFGKEFLRIYTDSFSEMFDLLKVAQQAQSDLTSDADTDDSSMHESLDESLADEENE